MPKMKTHSGAKKRFKVTGSGLKIKCAQANKRHGMRKRSNRQIRVQRGTDVLPLCEFKRIIQILPYAG